MRKALNKKLSGPSKLVGKVFQRQKSCNVAPQMTDRSSNLLQEVESLRGQVNSLKDALNSLKLDTENKEVKLAKLAREKEKLSMNLSKITRSNNHLVQQLEDERQFYFKEKEMYCQEMNEYKKLKRALSSSNMTTRSDNGEIEKLKKTLEDTLQTNYNLSVKFLRMKETKTRLCKSLCKAEEDHKLVVTDLKRKLDTLTTELKEILNQKFDAPLSPSNKKYLQLVNYNSSLVYENLHLQTQVDQLSLRLKRDKIYRTKSETSSRTHRGRSSRNCDKVIKIFEREKKASLPTLTILNEKEIGLKHPQSERGLQLPVVNESKLEVFQVSGIQSRSSETELDGRRKRSRSAPKIVQSVTFKHS